MAVLYAEMTVGVVLHLVHMNAISSVRDDCTSVVSYVHM